MSNQTQYDSEWDPNTLEAFQQLFDLSNLELDVYTPARTHFADFWRTTKPNMAWNWYNELLATKLQQFYEDVMAGKHPRLMIFAPPRHGKSEGASRRFPAWVFGKTPTVHIIACSYAAMLASRMNRDVQRIMDEPVYQDIFPDTRLNTENVATLSGKPLRNSDIFEIVSHLGSYRSAGVAGGITGQGFDIGIIDDPIADAASAQSEVLRQGIWEWYQTTFYSRKSPMSGILLIMTRWHEDDLAGRLLLAQNEGGEQWDIVRFPAIAEEDEKYRKEGEALHPGRFPLNQLETIKAVVGSYYWECMYQQRPGPKGGTIFARKNWQYWKALPDIEELILSVDCSFKDLNDSDYVAIQTWGRKGPNKFLIKRLRERMGFSATIEAIRNFKGLFPKVVAILIEDKANGSAVIETLRKEIAGVIAVQPEGGKVARAFAMQGEQEAGNIHLPDPTVDGTIETFLGEVSAFPSVTHDDETDAMTQAMNWFRTREGAYDMLEFMRRQLEKQKAQQAGGANTK